MAYVTVTEEEMNRLHAISDEYSSEVDRIADEKSKIMDGKEARRIAHEECKPILDRWAEFRAQMLSSGYHNMTTRKAELIAEATKVLKSNGYVVRYRVSDNHIEQTWYVFQKDGQWFFKMYGPQTKTAHKVVL